MSCLIYDMVVNASQFYYIKAGVLQGSLLGPTHFLLYINNLPRIILRTFVDIYTDDTTVYRYTYKIVDDQCLAADLSSKL